MASRTELDAIDPASGDIEALIGVDGFTAGGLAVIPVPEPRGRLMLASGLAMLTLLGRRRDARQRLAAPTARNRAL